MFHIGQRVVCVDDSYIRPPWKVHPKASLGGLTRGRIYTIREVGDFRGHACVWLEEIIREPIGSDPRECGFYVKRFRPVVERTTDISIFTAMLKPTRVDA